MFATHGALWLALKTTDELHDRAAATAAMLWPVLTIVIVSFLAYTWFDTALFDNFKANPLLFLVPLCAVIALLGMLVYIRRKDHLRAWFSSAAFILFVAVFGVLGMYPNIFAYRAEGSILPDASLSIHNAASGERTLIIMLVVAAVILPLVLFYQIWAYRIFRDKIKAEDLASRPSY
jgi:cytochrome d ubiquinol oxidase subunit II